MPLPHPTDEMSWVRDACTHPLTDLGEAAPELAGVLSRGYDPDVIARFVHEQFTSGAAEWAARYADTAFFSSLLRRAFGTLRPGLAGEPLRILDLGSGSGNTIFPLLELCPSASVVATDISAEMLAVLKRGLDAPRRGRCTLVQMNAEEIDFAPGTFDLVVGGAVLHHLFAPDRALAGAAKVLRPGGAAVFFEPFEAGNVTLALAYLDILADDRRARRRRWRFWRRPSLLRPDVRSLLSRLAVDFEARRGTDKTHPRFASMDDKWLFTASGLDAVARAHGFSRTRIEQILGTERPFQQQTETYLRLGAGAEPSALPGWAWERLRRLDARFSPEAKQDLLIEGIVVLER